jgi:hypothetical protein
MGDPRQLMSNSLLKNASVTCVQKSLGKKCFLGQFCVVAKVAMKHKKI